MGVDHFIKRAISTASDSVNMIGHIIRDPATSRTYFPEREHKQKITILWDNLLWLARYGEVNRFYFIYGLDCKSAPRKKEFLPYRKFMRIRNSKNLHPDGADFNYVCILRDKFVFSQFLSSLNFPTPKNKAILTSEQITWLRDLRSAPLETLTESTDLLIDGFCKELTGTRGSGVFPLKITGGRLFINEWEVSLRELKERLSRHYLLQERVLQHPRMNELYPHSVNTIRLITFNNNGDVKPFVAAQKIGTNGRSIDNWGAGGVAVGIDLESGRLRNDALVYNGFKGRVERHPDTGVLLHGFEVPYFHLAVEMACKLHSYLYGVHSIGWDIAVTPDGPMFIEGNDDWGGVLPLMFKENFKSSFMEMYSMKS
jgi:hypothetical protein